MIFQRPPRFVEEIAGLDWGWNAPGALMRLGITELEEFITHDEVYESEKDFSWWDERAISFAKTGVKIIIADSKYPAAVKALNKKTLPYGCRTIPADNSPGSVFTGIILLQMLMKIDEKTGRPKYLVRGSKCPNHLMELNSYKWAENPANMSLLEEPEAWQADHTIDSVRNAIYTHIFMNPQRFRTIRLDLLRR